MNQYQNCPACSSHIDTENQIGSTLICACGWSGTLDRPTEKRFTKLKSALYPTMAASFILGALVHTMHWDKHAGAVIPLQAKILLQVSDSNDHAQMAQICGDRKKHDCTEKNLLLAYKKETSQIHYLAQLGHQQFLRKNMDGAFETLTRYHQKGGEDHQAAFDYARVFASQNKVDQASRFFERALEHKPDVFQVTVATAYITMLLENDRLKEAEEVILKQQALGENTKEFMSKELSGIREKKKVAGA